MSEYEDLWDSVDCCPDCGAGDLDIEAEYWVCRECGKEWRIGDVE